MDYDKTAIADRYDAGRDIDDAKKHQVLSFFVDAVPAASVSDIVDLGCGTGRFSQTLADAFDGSVLGVDPSARMLEKARERPDSGRLRFAQGSGESIPAGDQSADMVFLSMVLHHLDDLAATARECARVLRPGGVVCVRNTVTDAIDTYPYLAFFPSIEAIISETLCSRQTLDDALGAAGLVRHAHRAAWHQVSPDWHSFAEKLALKADSFVARLPDTVFERGLRDIRTHAKMATGPAGLTVDCFVYRKETR